MYSTCVEALLLLLWYSTLFSTKTWKYLRVLQFWFSVSCFYDVGFTILVFCKLFLWCWFHLTRNLLLGMILNCPVNIYLFKVNNTNTRTRLEICSKLKRHQNDIDDIVLVFLLLTVNIYHTFFLSFHCWIWTSKC